MNKAKLKSYAPQARVDFIAAVTARANLLGLSEKSGQLEVAPAQTQGDVTVISGQPWPAKVASQREKLISRIKRDGFNQTCEAIAYTWFNRFAAIRYMELHDYLGHGHRALSSVSGGLPDILNYAADLATGGDSGLPGLKLDVVTEMKLAGNRDGDLYRMLLVAQCNALSRAMPFLFERIDDDSELLLPDNLLRSDSVIAKLVSEIPEEDWAEVEIIGWLYQFYISEKKDQVIGKVVKSEDIPAATQLFTPNWIVQYLVQNSVGRLWLMANPQSTLTKEWPYYITPAEQTPEVQAQLDALIQTRVREDGDTLNPESITVLDPACGSGHILVVAYDVLKAIYLERGYQPRSIPRLILEKNLYGLDIDDRAAQMAGFALMMKARADDRRLFNATDDAGNLQPPKLNVLSLQESKGLSVDELATNLAKFEVQRSTISALIDTLENAKTLGSLIQIPYALKTHLAILPSLLTLAKHSGDMYASAAADDLLPLVQQAQVLTMQFDAVVANPPYMGGKGMNPTLKDFAKTKFQNSKADLFAMFIENGFDRIKPSGFSAMVTMQSWMFLSSYQEMREKLLMEKTLSCMVHMGNGVMGIAFGTAATVMMNRHIHGFVGEFSFCDNSDINTYGVPTVFPVKNERLRSANVDNFKKIPGHPIAYWVGESIFEAFTNGRSLEEIADPRLGMSTNDNGRFLRLWYEIDFNLSKFDCENSNQALISTAKWYPYNKGGGFRKWYGNQEYVINYNKDGKEVKEYAAQLYGSYTRTVKNIPYFFRKGLTWSLITSGSFSVRELPAGFVIGDAGPTCYPTKDSYQTVFAVLNSRVSNLILDTLNPTVNFPPGVLKLFPVLPSDFSIPFNVDRLIELSKFDWDLFETSWNFKKNPLIQESNIHESFSKHQINLKKIAKEIAELETENNKKFIEIYKLNGMVNPEVGLSEVTLQSNPFFKYGADQTPSILEQYVKYDSAKEFISYAVGCMMGRYSLDEPGLVFAHAGNVGFEPDRYATFPADADGIVPITDELWFADDAPSRIKEFLRAVWGPDTLEENMAWLAESLGSKSSETPDETIRRYIADKFFKDHLQTYKKRPIYWLFSSGKQGAFQALVYLHRYSEGTLARLRAEYVVPLTGKIQSRIEMLQRDAATANSTAARNKLSKEVEKLEKKHAELLAFDEQLRHYADMRITLDLDDGVKVNYGKFGNLLSEVKVVTGGGSDD